MEEWTWWVGVGVTTVVGMLVRSSFAEKKRVDDLNSAQENRLSLLEKEIAILKETALNEKEVRLIIREENADLHKKIDKMDNHIEETFRSIQDLKVALARDMYHNTATKDGCK